ncbi:MAG: hypothetical protein GF329_14620, partial [Candidatus Lokiarchaeota archaeon]|nr:hypothetical protein [Candidatus Lokiarchaeota archaeon]
MKTKIFYFSGSGNSFYVAKEIHKRIPNSELLPIAAILNKNLNSEPRSIEIKAESVGFIFPCHGLAIPIAVKRFLKKIDVRNSKYFFSIASRGGSVFRGFSIMNKILAKQKKQLNASFVLTMGMNDPKLGDFYVPSDEELQEIENNVQKRIAEIEEIINNRKDHKDDISGVSFTTFGPLNYILEKLIIFIMYKFAPGQKKYFYADKSCIGCGICE